MNNCFIRELRLSNLLSFGPETEVLEFQPLNVLIGVNGAGKSNLLEAISLLRAAPTKLSAQIKESGGVRDWLWKGTKNATATIETVLDNPDLHEIPLRHSFSFTEHGQRFEITTEKIENNYTYPGQPGPFCYYSNEEGRISLGENAQANDVSEDPLINGRTIKRENVNPEESILSQVKDPERYPYLAYLSDNYSRIQLYRDWSFGRNTSPRQPQKADVSGLYLSEMCDNLPLVLNSLRPIVKDKLISTLKHLYGEIEDFNVQIVGGWVQLFLEEGGFSIPATRLSDGTLRFLCLLAILLHPEPPPVVCIEEPELGLHPDIIPMLADLLIEASEKMQLIVTTHSDILVDALSDRPECVVVCEKQDGRTKMRRLRKEELAVWLDKYRLGQLWTKGEIGGTRW